MTNTSELYACLYVREFPAQALLRLRAELHVRPCVVMDGEALAQHVCSLNSKARQLGIRHGMTRVEVDTFPEPQVLVRSPKTEAATRGILLECAGAFSPRIEDASEEGAFLCGIDISGTRSLFQCLSVGFALIVFSHCLSSIAHDQCDFPRRCFLTGRMNHPQCKPAGAEGGALEMGLLANLKIRTKVFLALLPLAVMVVAAVLYSSIEIKQIDSWYSGLLRRDVAVLQKLTAARTLSNQFSLLLYQEIAESDADRMRVIDTDLDQTATEFHFVVEEAKLGNPSLAPALESATELFDRAASDSRPVRAATLSGDNEKAMRLMRESAAPEMARAQEALIALAERLRASVSQQSDQLTARTHRTILITWIVLVLGLVTSFIVALFIVQVQIVKVVLSLRRGILDVAEGRLETPIANLNCPNEIGEMSRALQTLQIAAREREILGWIKTEVAITTEHLQPTEDFVAFSTVLLSRISETLDLIYGAFYLADEDRTRFTRVGESQWMLRRNHESLRLVRAWWDKRSLRSALFGYSLVLT